MHGRPDFPRREHPELPTVNEDPKKTRVVVVGGGDTSSVRRVLRGADYYPMLANMERIVKEPSKSKGVRNRWGQVK